MEYRNPSYNQFGTINVEINHSMYGWIPFTASPEDPEQLGRDLYDTIVNSGESVAPYIPPEAPPTTLPDLTPRQVRLGLLSIGITEGAIEAVLEDDPEALIEWRYATNIERQHPLVSSLGEHFELPAVQIDTLWLWAADL